MKNTKENKDYLIKDNILSNVEMEKNVLSCVIFHPNKCDYQELIPEMFSSQLTSAIYSGVCATMKEYGRTDVILIFDYIRQFQENNNITVDDITKALLNNVYLIDNYELYLETLTERAIRRIGIAEIEIAKLKFETAYIDPVSDMLTSLSDKLVDIRDKARTTKYTDFSQGVTMDQISDDLRNRDFYLNTGYKLWDDSKKEWWELTIAPNALTYIAGATGHCKTTFLINLVCNILKIHPHKKVLFVTYEESLVDIQLKVLNTFVGMPLGKNNTKILLLYYMLQGSSSVPDDVCRYDKEDYLLFINNKQMLNEFKEKEKEFNQLIKTGRLIIQGTSYDADELIDILSYMRKKRLMDIAFIDYIQLIEDESEECQRLTHDLQVKHMVKKFMDLTKDKSSGFPLVFGAQFNRSVSSVLDLVGEKIGEANAIEKSAHSIFGVYYCKKTIDPGSEEKRNEICAIQGTSVYNEDVIFLKAIKRRGDAFGQHNIFKYEGNIGHIIPTGEPTSQEIYHPELFKDDNNQKKTDEEELWFDNNFNYE